jgi:hypothetical protein
VLAINNNIHTGGVFQVGPTTEEFDRLELDLPDLRASSDTLGLGKVSLSSQQPARTSLNRLDIAIDKVRTTMMSDKTKMISIMFI